MAEEISILYRIRWLIEFFFKLCKSEAKLGKTQGKTGDRCLCEIYAKLPGILLAHWLMLKRCGQLGEASTVRMFRKIQANVQQLGDVLLTGDEEQIIECLRKIDEQTNN